MGLRIIYGKAGCGKSSFCFSEISKLIKTDEKIFIVTPEQFSFTAEKKLMECVNQNAVINAEVITLSRMAYRVMGEVGNNGNSNLSKAAKAMIMNYILDINKQKLKFLGKSDQNIDLSIQAITEFKKHGITVDDLKQNIENIENKYLKTKLNDMLLIYENFENHISNKYIDDTDLLTYLAQNIDKVDLIKNSIIYIDEFMGFTTQEYSIIKKFIQIAKQVNICLCIDNLNPASNPITDIFYSNKLTLYKLINLIQENNLKLEEPVQLNKLPRFKNKELKHLEKNIYNTQSTNYEENVENIKLFLAKNQYSEVENVAKNITKLVKHNNLRYKEISVITKDMNSYSSLIRAIFNKYDIPVFIDEKRDLNQNIIIKYILGLLEVISKNFSYDSVISYIKTGFCGIEEDEIFKLENYCTKWGIKYSKWKNDFEYGIKDEKDKQDVQRLNEIRKEIINPIIKLKNDLNNKKTYEAISRLIYEFIVSQNIENKVIEKIQKLEDKGLIDLANEYKKSYEIVISLLDDIVETFGDTETTIEKYINSFKVGLKNSSLGKIPGTQDQVIVGDVERSRSHKVKVIFIIGINDGVFPSNNKDEGFFNDSDREILKLNGIELAKGTIENLYEENFNIYKAFTTAEEQLYLSYASTDSEGKSLRPSMLIIKLKKIFLSLKEESDVITKKYEITNKNVTYEQLLENIYKLNENEQIDDIWYMVYNYYKNQNDYQISLKNDLEGLEYTNLPKDIDKEIVDKLYGNTLNTSVSRLEKYRSCPFSYYLQYGLKLKEKEELKVQSFNTGSFMHETIDSFFQLVREENLSLAQLMTDEEMIEKLVAQIIEEKLKLSSNYIFTATSKYKILVKRLKKIITKALKYIIEGLVYSEFDIQGTEVEFSNKGKYKPIILNLEDGKKVEITGKIDRIDTAQNEQGKYIRIIDYKSSDRSINLNELEAGTQIQLLTYLDTAVEKTKNIPVGMLYFNLIDPVIKASRNLTDEQIQEELKKQFRMSGMVLADVNIIRMMDKNLQTGASSTIPVTLDKNGDIMDSRSNAITKEQFTLLQNKVKKIIKQIAKEILEGNIEIKPTYNKGKKEEACKYCEYKSICCFNPNVNNYSFIDNKSKKELLDNLQ